MGNNKRVISLGPIVNALGDEKAEALLGFHAFSEADITGRFAGKGKLTGWQAFSTLRGGGGICICCLRDVREAGS